MDVSIPTLRAIDSSLAFLGDGYTFGSRRFEKLRTDAFRTRLMFRPVVFMRGEEAARWFYEDAYFTRAGAVPASVMHLLQDEGSVQSLDGAEHDHRKAMFLHLAYAEAIDRVTTIFESEWDRAVEDWAGRDSIVLHAELLPLLARTAARFAGVPLDEALVTARAGELADMIENAGRFGPPNWAARVKRQRTERWAEGVIRGARSGAIEVEPETTLDEICSHRDRNGEPLSDAIAAIELINVLRPIVAVGRFIVFAALALHNRAADSASFAAGTDEEVEAFVHEVRRYYPFFPVVGGRARVPLEWRGNAIELDAWVLLDLYGTNHDPRLWPEPRQFRPERFIGWDGNPNTLIPQGGGSVGNGHRCPGESITVALMKSAVRKLTWGMTYAVADEDLRVSLRRFPAIPQDGFVMRSIRAVAAS